MKSLWITVVSLALGVSALNMNALSASADTGVVPPHTIPARFVPILTKFRKIYSPMIEARGGRLVIDQRWNDPLLSANADRQGPHGEIWLVGISMGMYRFPAVTDDAFRFAICHEMGHLLGGAPKRPVPMEWDGPTGPDGKMLISAEAEADYYANLKCMRLMLADENNQAYLALKNVPPRVRDRCDAQFSDPKNSEICQRSTLAVKDFLDMFNAQFPPQFRPKYSFDTPSTERVEKTNDFSYPDRQCRLDTAVSAALCTADVNVQLDSADPSIGACTRKGGYKVGLRPACWYAGDGQ